MKLYKRLLSLALICTLVGGGTTAIAGVNAEQSPHTILVDGQKVNVQVYNIFGNNYFKLRDIADAVDFGVIWDGKTETVLINPSQSYQPEITGSATAPTRLLQTGNWATATRTRLNKLITEYGSSSASYDKNNRPYAVFDFDNTTCINDVEEALLIYQLENLEFKIKPDQMKDVLETGIPDVNQKFSKDYGELTVEKLATDISSAYKTLYASYKGFGAGGTSDLAAVKKTDAYKAFTTKLRYMYDAVNDTFDASVGYPWVTYLFTGMTSSEVYKLAEKSHKYWTSYGEFTKETWTSPSSLPGVCGVLSVSYKTGITITDEVKDLYNTLMANGIDVYVVSASFIDVIRAAAANPEFGLNVKESNIYAMMLKKDASGRYINEYDDNYFQTQGKGKVHTINAFIRGQYGNRGPIMVAGDSAGDFNMLSEYDDMKVGLIFNRYRSDSTKALAQQAAATIGQANAKYILQGRDENKGQLRASEKTILLGQTEEVLVRQ